MATVSTILSRLHIMTVVFFTLMLLELIILLRSITTTISNHNKHIITTTQFLKLIEDNNPTIYYSKKSKSPPTGESSECAVCLSELEEGEKIRRLRCKHTFHRDCLDKWLQHYLATCPLCRNKILPDEIVARFHRRQQDVMEEEYDGSDEEMMLLLSALHGNSLHRFSS